MPSLHALWRTLEREVALAGVEAQWRLWLGETLDTVRPFLKPEQELATSYPCERQPDTCARRVVHHGPDDIVAVCGMDLAECERLPLARAEVVVHALPLPRLLAKVGDALGCSGDVQPVTGARAWSLGVRPGGGAVFFVLPDRESGYSSTLASVLAHHPAGDLAVLVPCADSLSASDRSLLSQRRATVILCDEVLDLDDAGALVRRSPTYTMPTPEVLTVRDGAGEYGRKPIAICWRHDSDAPVQITKDEDLATLRALEQDVDHFVDATLDKPCCSKRNGKKKRDTAELMPGEVAMLLAFMARRVAGRDHERPESLRISNLSTAESKKQAFKEMRRKVDRNTASRQKYALFKARRSLDGGPQLYEIRPDDGVTFCFLVRPDDLEQIRRCRGPIARIPLPLFSDSAPRILRPRPAGWLCRWRMGRREKHRRSSMQKSSQEHEWRCRKCRSLLGVERSGRLHLKYKDAQFVVEGTVMAVCRRCSELNETQSCRQRDARSIARA